MNLRQKLSAAVAFATVVGVAAVVGTASASVTTDKADYSPGSTVTISGQADDAAPYQAGETVDVAASNDNGLWSSSCTAVVDDAGAWSCSVTLDSDPAIAGGSYTYTASGETSGASETSTFTDDPGGPQPVAEVPWDGNGTIAGACKSFKDDPTMTPAPGQQGWLFVFTNAQDPALPVLSYDFSDGTVGTTTGINLGGSRTWHIVVYTTAGATLDSASATLGMSNSVLTVSHCTLGDDDTEEDPPLLSIDKTAAGTYTTTYVWDVTKVADKTIVKQQGGSVLVTYTVDYTKDDGTVSDIVVSGTITASNSGTLPVNLSDMTDVLSDGTECTIDGGEPTSLPAGNTEYEYSCALDALPESNLTNTVTMAWDEQQVGNATLTAAEASSDPIPVGFTETKIDDCASVSDTYAGSSVTGSICADTQFTYQRTIPVVAGCVNHDNTASLVTANTPVTDSASATVRVCGPLKTGALTIGFWQNKNGQALITGGASTATVCNSGTWLRQFAPFQDLSATAKCAAVATYVTNVIKAANASGASMNAMLKAQMLSTALDVYFSSTGLGSTVIDLTMICQDLSCAAYENSGPAFGNATSLSVFAMLQSAAGQSSLGGSLWYGNNKAMQELAKDAFDAINNEKAFGI